MFAVDSGLLRKGSPAKFSSSVRDRGKLETDHPVKEIDLKLLTNIVNLNVFWSY